MSIIFIIVGLLFFACFYLSLLYNALMPAGRPTNYNIPLVTLVCDRISNGESLRKVCRDPAMPGLTTIQEWVEKYPEFAAQYEKACQCRADFLADELEEIADNAEPENVQVAKLRVDVRKWAASKLRPKRYGDSMLNKLADSEGNALKFEPVIISRSDK